MSALQEAVARAIEDAWEVAGEDDGDPAADALVAASIAIFVVLGEARRSVEASRLDVYPHSHTVTTCERSRCAGCREQRAVDRALAALAALGECA